MDWTPDKKKRTAWWIIGVVTVCILVFLGVRHIKVLADAVFFCLQLVSPLLLGLALAMILNVPMRFLESHLWPKATKKLWQGCRRPVAYALSLAVILGVLVGVVWLVIPELVGAFTVLVEMVVDLANTINGMDRSEIAQLPLGNVLLNADWDGLMTTAQNWLKNQGGTIVNTAFDTIGSLAGGIFDFFIAFVFSIYILFSKEKLKVQVCRLMYAWLPRNVAHWTIHAARIGSANFRNFISGQSIEAVILGVLCMLGMVVLGLPYAPMVGALVGVAALVPVVGSVVGAIVGAFMILTVNPMDAVVFVVFLIVLQQLEGNLIYPRVMGSRVNLPGMWILAAVTVGGGLAGPVGMLLSVPIAATAYALLKEATVRRERR